MSSPFKPQNPPPLNVCHSQCLPLSMSSALNASSSQYFLPVLCSLFNIHDPLSKFFSSHYYAPSVLCLPNIIVSQYHFLLILPLSMCSSIKDFSFLILLSLPLNVFPFQFSSSQYPLFSNLNTSTLQYFLSQCDS